MFGESVFALVPDHEVRAAKLTNRWISGCWWRRDALWVYEHLVGTKHALLKCRSFRRSPGQQGRREFWGEPKSPRVGPGQTVEVLAKTKFGQGPNLVWPNLVNFDVGMDSGISGPPVAPRPDEGTSTAKAQVDIPTVPPNARPPEVHVPEVRAQGVHVKVLRIGAL